MKDTRCRIRENVLWKTKTDWNGRHN